MDKEKIMEIRKVKKKKKPDFIRQDTNKKKRLKNNAVWRRPKGRHSKMRLGKAGHEAMPSLGWSSPKEVRGLHKSGLMPVLVFSLKDLDKIKEGEGLVIGNSVGDRKKNELIKKSEEKGLKILNIKDTKRWVEKIQKEREAKKQKRLEREKKKSEKPKKKEKKKQVKEKEEPVDEEAKKEEEKKEKDKVLTKKT